MAHSLLFIPDISGFTHFVNTTEVAHSQHIIAELLELLIDSDELNLEVSEIEGDAILFYKFESTPTAAELIDQAQKTFLAFHNHLIRYDLHRICNCGACSTASNLTLKIIAHQGEVGMMQVKQFQNLYGADVIIAHRLMKNEIPFDEYLLMTKSNLSDEEEVALVQKFPWAIIESGSANYPQLGRIEYIYISLAPLHQKVETADTPPEFERMPNPVVDEIFVHEELEEVFELISNLGKRMLWNKSLKDLKYEAFRVNRSGTGHVCVLPAGKLHFETLASPKEKNKRYFVERVKDIPFAKEVVFVFELTRSEQEGYAGTHIRYEAHFKPLSIIGKLIDSFVRKQITKTLQTQLVDIKKVAESEKSDLKLA